MAGGKGVTKVITPKDISSSLNNAFDFSQSKNIVVEQFIDGTQHSFSTFIVDKRVRASFSDNEYSTINPYTVSTSTAP